jgi:hypothetical protein
MTDTIGPVDGLNDDDRQRLAQRLVDQARAQNVDLVGPEGLLTGLTKTVLGPHSRKSSPDTSAMTATTRPVATAATPATAPGRRRC